MLVLIFVITAAGAEGTCPPCLISGLIFHFIAHLSISNNTNGSICMTGFVTRRIRCQTRLNITPAHYHNQPSNECGRWCERLGWIREKGFSTLPSGGWVTEGLNRSCGPSGPNRGAPLGGKARALWCWRDKATQATHTHTYAHTHTHHEDRRGELLKQPRGSIWGLLTPVYPQLWILMCGAITEDRSGRVTPALDRIGLSPKWGNRIIKMQRDSGPDIICVRRSFDNAFWRCFFFSFQYTFTYKLSGSLPWTVFGSLLN